MDDAKRLAWEMFKKSGNIGSYLLYKALKEQGDGQENIK